MEHFKKQIGYQLQKLWLPLGTNG